LKEGFKVFPIFLLLCVPCVAARDILTLSA
jgi:hypothetical protein